MWLVSGWSQQEGSTGDVNKDVNGEGLNALDRETIQGGVLTEAAEPGDDRKECDEEEIASVKPPGSP